MHDRWWQVLLGSVMALAVLQLIDAFFVEFPVLAVVLALIFLVTAYWLSKRSRASVLFAGILCFVRLVLALAFIFAGPTASLSAAEVVLVASFAVVAVTGISAAVGTLGVGRLRRRA